MSDAETSAYLLLAAGAFWILVGIVGLRGAVESNDETVDQYPEERNASGSRPKQRQDFRPPNE
jgi:hypothetical protein